MNGSENTAIITLCEKGLGTARRIAVGFPESRIFVHQKVSGIRNDEQTFGEVIRLVSVIWREYGNLVFVLPLGVAVRAIGCHVVNKHVDPAVVVADVGGRWAISLLCGHEGGANGLTLRISNILDAEPVITTTGEAAKFLIVGVGCRRDTPCKEITDAICHTFSRFQLNLSQVRLLASADIKKQEQGILEASRILNVPVRFVSSAQLAQCPQKIGESPFVKEKVGLPGVAEPAALLAGRRTSLLVPKQKFRSVTIAVAKENCTW
jgi:cobalt-precorrin 5A hydrolase